ncbi:MAG: hypothetical protein AAGE80_15390 [Pseudomonadota bacterium]
MPLDRIVLYIVGGLATLASLLYVIALLVGAITAGPWGFVVILPLGITAYIVYRIIMERLSSREDDYYDSIEK